MGVKWEWKSGLHAVLCLALSQGEAGQGSTREGVVICLPWNLVSLGWSTSTTTAQNALQPSLTHVIGPISVRNLKLLECIWLVPFTVPTHHLLCKWGSSGNFYTREDSCPGKGVLCRQNGAPQAAHGEQAALGSMYKYHGDDGRIDKGVFHRELAARGLLFLGWQQPLLSPVLVNEYRKIWIYHLPK